MNTAVPLDSPNNWRRGPGSVGGGGAGGGGPSPYGQGQGNYGPMPPTGILNERDVPRNNYPQSDIQSPLSPTSDFSLSKYDQQRNYTGDMPTSRSNQSIISQRSSGAPEIQESVISDHYTELYSYVRSAPVIDGILT